MKNHGVPTRKCGKCGQSMFNSSYRRGLCDPEGEPVENHHCSTRRCGMHFHDGTWRTQKEHDAWLEAS